LLTVASERVVSAIITDFRIICKPKSVVVVGKKNEPKAESNEQRAESREK
jgi:hypothetical protein